MAEQWLLQGRGVEQASLAAGFSSLASTIAPGSEALADEAANVYFCSSIDSSRLIASVAAKIQTISSTGQLFSSMPLVRSAWITSA